MQIRDLLSCLPGSKSLIFQRSFHKERESMTDSTAGPILTEPSDLESFLIYYCTLKEPGYAVLVTGEWGIGKSYQVHKAIGAANAYYVSLFGLKSSEEILSAVFAKMHPNKAAVKKFVGKFDGLSANVGPVSVSGFPQLANAFIRDTVLTDRPIVFDDLERCNLEAKQLFGVINLYVEHHRCSVVVIAHDELLAKDFSTTKEKLFGQTIKAVPQTDDAMESFLRGLLHPPMASILRANRNIILEVFFDSQLHSLRLLKYIISDLERLLLTLSDRHLKHQDAMKAMISLFAALNLEFRTGRISADDLSNRDEALVAYQMRGPEKSKDEGQAGLGVVSKKYRSVDFADKLLQDEVLKAMFVHGRYDEVSIRRSLDASSYFLEKESPAWQVVGSFDKLDDKIVSDALHRMRLQFEERQVTDSGEMLHIFSLRMMLVDAGALSGSVDDVKRECIEYINDLEKTGRLPARSFEANWSDQFESSAAGIGYWINSSYRPQFEEVFEHLVSTRERVLDQSLPMHAQFLVQLLMESGRGFYEKLCHSRTGDFQFGYIPVLKAVDPKEFCKHWLSAPKEHWYWIAQALKERKEQASRSHEMASEGPVIDQIRACMAAEAVKLGGIPQLRIERQLAKI